jgi:hypothetical protein
METKTRHSALSQEEKLKAIIQKAQRNGYSGVYPFGNTEQVIPFVFLSHDFAKAFWGYSAVADFETGEVYRHKAFEEDGGETPIWKWQLQQLALTPPAERIDYLYKFVNE